MNVVDSSGWIEYLADGPNARHFEAVLARPDTLVVPSITILEVGRYLMKWKDPDSAELVAARMQQATVVGLDAVLALDAARIGLELKLPLADSVVLATARAHGATLWTQDADFENIAGVRFFRKR